MPRTNQHLIKHGKCETKEYGVWCGMKRRCYVPKDPGFKNYGGRGIKVCERWKHSFANFLADMGERPSPNHSINRINNDGPYSPENCEWADRVTQNNSSRTSEYNKNFGARMAAKGMYHNRHLMTWLPNKSHGPPKGL
jgi:hypothetical protein